MEEPIDLERIAARVAILEARSLALANWTEVTAAVWEAPDTEQARQALMSKFDFSKVQTEFVLEMNLRNISESHRDDLEEELNELRRLLSDG